MGVDNPDYPAMVRIQEKLFTMARQSANDLGLTISSRCKLVVPKKEEKEVDPIAAKFGDI